MKVRHPRSFATAIYRILEGLGAQACARLVSRSTAAVYKWSDPDLAHSPTLSQALALDMEYVRRGLGPPPLFVAYAALLKDVAREQKDVRESSMMGALDDIGRLVSTASDIMKDFSQVHLMAKTNEGANQKPKCGICNSLRQLSELVISLEWKIEQDADGSVCPIKNGAYDNVRCLKAEN